MDGGRRASGGSWYLRTMSLVDGAPGVEVWVVMVLESAARMPVGLKLGVCFSTGGAGVGAEGSEGLARVVKAAAWEGRGARSRGGLVTVVGGGGGDGDW